MAPDGSGSEVAPHAPADPDEGTVPGTSDDELTAAMALREAGRLLSGTRRGHIQVLRPVGPRKRPGPPPGRRRNHDRDFEVGQRAIVPDFFSLDGRPAVFSEENSERRSRVPRYMFECIIEAVKDKPLWARRINATAKPQACPLQKLFSACLDLSHGETYDRPNEYVRQSR